MPKIPVVQYAAEWNPHKNTGKVYTLFADGRRGEVPIDTKEEMALVILMLGKSPALFDSDTKELEMPWRPVGT